MKVSCLFYGWFAVLLLFSCKDGGKTASFLGEGGDTLDLRYAENLKIVSYDGYRVATLRNPWDTLEILHTYVLVGRDEPLPDSLPQGTVVRVPLQKAVIYSSVHCGLMEELGALSAVGGVCDLRYIDLPYVKEGCRTGRIADLGSGMNPDIEKLMALHPEWMRFYGLLFGKAAESDSLFARVEADYLWWAGRVADIEDKPTVFADLKSGATWYVPGGRSTVGRTFADAGADYVFSDLKNSGSSPLSFETVYEKAKDADIWLIKYNMPEDKTYRDLKNDYAPYAGFRAFRERRVYGCNTGRVPYYEETPFHPEWLLEDLIKIFHPDVATAEGGRYFRKLAD